MEEFKLYEMYLKEIIEERKNDLTNKDVFILTRCGTNKLDKAEVGENESPSLPA